ncbi:AAA family ATPase [Sphingomonas sp. DT-207]|uniref:AAA family ATPase n=1 Tax=Sphingomonas sp. DT-207 TaxID=3396167 RepID=UPI003F1E1D07
MADHLFVITGGPGSGKTSLVNALAEAGLAHMPEAGRAIIRDQVAIGGNALPWADRALFAELMLAWELRAHREAGVFAGPVILDRGVPDVLGYLRLCGLPIPDHMRRAAEQYRYNRTVFVAPHWPEIFAQDSERKQDPDEAEATCVVMRRIYAELGYRLVELPRVGIAERAAFVRARISTAAG